MKTRLLSFAPVLFLLAVPAFADTFGTGTNQFTIDFVTIGSPWNLPDDTGDTIPPGSVPAVYQIHAGNQGVQRL